MRLELPSIVARPPFPAASAAPLYASIIALGVRASVNLRRDMAHALRLILRSPGFSLVIVLTLALGIGANTAIFTIFDALLLRTLPVWRPDRLVQVADVYRNASSVPLSYALYRQLRQNQRVFSDLFAWSGAQESELEFGNARALGTVRAVSGNYYAALGTTPFLGRLIAPEDADSAGRAPVAVLGYEYWERQFGGDRAIVGKIIHIRGEAYSVIGVSRPWFTGMTPGTAPDITVAITAPRFAVLANNHASLWLFIAGRLKDGVTGTQAEAQLRSFWHDALLASPPTTVPGPRLQSFLNMKVRVIPIATGINAELRTRLRRPLQALMALASLILLVACVNLANLTLARTVARSREMAIRLSLGARPWHLVRQILGETLILSVAGTCAAIPLAASAGQMLVSMIAGRGSEPVILDLCPDWRVFAFAAGTAIVTALMIALAPAWQAVHRQPGDVLRFDDRTTASGSGRLGSLLIVGQIAISLVLLVGAALFVRTLENLRRFDPQYRKQGVLEVQLYPRTGAPKVDEAVYRRELIDNIAALPSVGGAAYANYAIPLGNQGWQDNVTALNSFPGDDTTYAATLIVVSPGFFRALGIPLVSGRLFDDSDDEHHLPVAIVDSNLAIRLAPSGDATRMRVRFGVQPEFQQMEIVGVTRPARIIDVRDSTTMIIYVPAAQHPQFSEEATLYVSAENPTALERPIERQVGALGQEFVAEAKTLEVADEDALVEERATALLSGAFAVLGLLLAGLGLFGLMSYTVTRRTRELAIRMALGSERADILRLVLRRSLILTASGLAIGVPFALIGASLLRRMLFGVAATDPLTLSISATALLVVGVAAGYWPAHRATGISPAIALKAE